jgi:Predicted membrane protein (DUF2207)
MRYLLSATGTLLALLCACGVAHGSPTADGGITSFRADITVREDAMLEVREELAVNSAGVYYKYGFMRLLPISSNDRWDRRYVGEYKKDNGIRVTILEVTQDGSPVKYEQGSGWGYPQLRIGEKDVPLTRGDHLYVIRYTVDGALNLGTDGDTLYWNAIGHERDVPVAEAIVTVHLPAFVPATAVQAEARAGGRGVSYARGPETRLERIDDSAGAVTYRATQLGPRQSLSVVVTWPAGFVHKPKLQILNRDRWLFAAPAALFFYYLIAWLAIGREPQPGAVVTRYQPPDGLSAAAVRYVVTTGSDGRSFAAVIAQLACRGCLRVEPRNGKYKLSRLMSDRAAEAKLAPEEQRVLTMLFEDGPIIELTPTMDQRNSAQNSRYIFHIQEELRKRLDGKYFTRHLGVAALGVLTTFASALILAAMAQGRDASGALFFTIWILFCGLILGMMIEMSFATAWRTAVRAGTGWVKLLPGLAAVGVFVAAIGYLLRQLAEGVSPAFAVMIVSFLLINLGWGPQLKRTTVLGRQILDQIAGFRLFLEEVEKDRLDKLNPANEAPQALEEYLPYAIALEVKEAWGDHLAQTFLATTVMR